MDLLNCIAQFMATDALLPCTHDYHSYGVLVQAGSLIVDNLRAYGQPVIVYLPPGAELRGGAWVVIDAQINPAQVSGMICVRVRMMCDYMQCKALVRTLIASCITMLTILHCNIISAQQAVAQTFQDMLHKFTKVVNKDNNNLH